MQGVSSCRNGIEDNVFDLHFENEVSTAGVELGRDAVPVTPFHLDNPDQENTMDESKHADTSIGQLPLDVSVTGSRLDLLPDIHLIKMLQTILFCLLEKTIMILDLVMLQQYQIVRQQLQDPSDILDSFVIFQLEDVSVDNYGLDDNYDPFRALDNFGAGSRNS
ncbi:hypothetical protein BSLG_005731 [Batrachochytrium salamandrivorans]|nr:hypothetical protein BSLG_005731 [Batrachochytrium salamandrivorans]